ncbi:collectin-11 [Plakobranchus ocellatus]|uniref:Collectin-11 n=1 Tax=Plakobranchus ocellatus TaxID=259542 RepID=A0AAV4D296_9GAST|nr:collectin-11 [Plakobranchus ocellatus]
MGQHISSSTAMSQDISSSTDINQHISSSTDMSQDISSSTDMSKHISSSTDMSQQTSNSAVVGQLIRGSTAMGQQISDSAVVDQHISGSTAMGSKSATPQSSASTPAAPQPWAANQRLRSRRPVHPRFHRHEQAHQQLHRHEPANQRLRSRRPAHPRLHSHGQQISDSAVVDQYIYSCKARTGLADKVKDVCPDKVIKSGTKLLKVYDGKCYQFFQDHDVKKQFWEAEDECKKDKGLLAMPKTEKINQFLVDSLKEYKIKEPVFIGLDDIGHEAYFKWADGKDLDVSRFYHNFAKDTGILRKRSKWNPFKIYDDYDCVTLDPLTTKWVDIDCRRGVVQKISGWEKNRLFICEY